MTTYLNYYLRIAMSNGLGIENLVESQINELPKNIFGVFVSVERKTPIENKEKRSISNLKNQLSTEHPERMIHGCIGMWNSKHQPLTDKEIKKFIAQVSRDAVNNDERKNNFTDSIYLDFSTKFTIYFMKLPLYSIDNNGIDDNSQTYNNATRGILVENDVSSKRATFLPGIFHASNISWIDLKKLLLTKAGIDDDNNNKFFAYDCVIISSKMDDFFIEPIIDFVNKYFTIFVPYSVVDNQVIIDKQNDIRNLAVTYSILLLQKKYHYLLSKNARNVLVATTGYYKNRYYLEPPKKHQMSTFLMLSLMQIDSQDSFINVVKNDLLRYLSSNSDIEKDIEWGEILYAISIVEPSNEEVKKQVKILYQYDKTNDYDVFRANWLSKQIDQFGKLEKYQLLKRAIDNFEDIFSKNETNYDAVQFEMFCFYYPRITSKRKRQTIEIITEKLMKRLESHRTKYGLYAFNNGDVRLDITSHVLMGFLELKHE